MYLTDVAIYALVKNGGMIEPFDVNSLQPCSYDLSLADCFLRLKDGESALDPTEDMSDEYEADTRFPGKEFYIYPGEFMLASTIEKIRLPKDVAAMVKGKSSLGRLGLTIQNAGHIDSGFCGNITLELKNETNRPIRLTYLDKIGQIIFVRTTGSANRVYNGKYQNQEDVTGSRSEWDYMVKPPNLGEDY